MNTRWWMTAVAVPAAMLVALVVIPLPFAGDLPDPIATHWGSGGAPNGSMATWGLVTLAAALFTVIWLVSLAAHRGGIKQVLIPEDNVKDLVEIPDNIKNKLDIQPVKWIEQVLEFALESNPEPLSDEEQGNAAPSAKPEGPQALVKH